MDRTTRTASFLYVARLILIAVAFSAGGWPRGLATLAILMIREVFTHSVFGDMDERTATWTHAGLALLLLLLEAAAYALAFVGLGVAPPPAA